jgi:hypothetical protein
MKNTKRCNRNSPGSQQGINRGPGRSQEFLMNIVIRTSPGFLINGGGCLFKVSLEMACVLGSAEPEISKKHILQHTTICAGLANHQLYPHFLRFDPLTSRDRGGIYVGSENEKQKRTRSGLCLKHIGIVVWES